MYAVVFEVLPSPEGMSRYLEIAAGLRPRLERIDGFVSVERFRCLDEPRWLLSLSFWRDEAALMQWRMHGEHRAAQAEGRQSVFDDYRLRVLRFGTGGGHGGRMLGLREHDGGIAAGDGRRFAGLADARRQVDLFETGDVPGVRWGEVIRDYGMYERAQAPQSFPAVAARTR